MHGNARKCTTIYMNAHERMCKLRSRSRLRDYEFECRAHKYNVANRNALLMHLNALTCPFYRMP